MTRLTTIATEYDDTFKKVKKTQRTVNNASRGGGGRSGRGETRGGRSTGRGRGTGNVAANTGWIDPEKWKNMSSAEQQQAKDANAAARLQAARDRKQQSERTIANLLQKAGQYGSVPTAVTVPTSTPVTFDLQSLAGSAATSTIATAQTTQGNRLINVLRNSTAPISINNAQSSSGGTTVSGNMVTDASGNTTLQLALNMAERQYRVTMASHGDKGALVDRGANGGLAGADMRVIETVFGSTVDVTGIGDAAMNDLPIVQAASLIHTKIGPIIGLFNQYAYTGKGRSIHSSLQMESWGVEVNETSRKARVPGKQRLVTVDGHRIPIHIRNGLPFIDTTYPTEMRIC
jgi:hypothetical protein